MADLRTRLRRWFARDEPHETPSIWPKRAGPVTPEAFGDAHNDFAVAMYGQLRRRRGNLCFSPFSVRTALGMVYVGARGETAAEMRAALRIPADADETFHRTSGDVLRHLNRERDEHGETIVANSVWTQHASDLEPAFSKVMAEWYRSEVHLLDCPGECDTARVRINQWVADITRDRIQDLIAPGALRIPVALVLINAVYFKGSWSIPFRGRSTHDEPFRLPSGGAVTVSMMQQQAEVAHVQARGYQAVELSYRDGDLTMLVVLPDREDGLADLEEKLSVRMLHDCVAGMTYRMVNLFLPRFEIRPDTMDLSAPIAALGMPLAFDRVRADFSGINGRRPPDERAVFVSAILHKTFIEVNERGTEAAAATAVAVPPMASRFGGNRPKIPIFRADHPFLFGLRDRTSGALLFLGRLADPGHTD